MPDSNSIHALKRKNQAVEQLVFSVQYSAGSSVDMERLPAGVGHLVLPPCFELVSPGFWGCLP